MSLAEAGHGATLAMELDPTGAQGVFTVVSELASDIDGLALSRSSTEVTPHEDDIDSYVHGVLKRDPLTFTCNFIYGGATHTGAKGLRDNIITGTRFGIRFRGVGGTDDTDEIIASGEVINWKEVNPAREGARSAEITFQPSKAFIVDGVTKGNAA